MAGSKALADLAKRVTGDGPKEPEPPPADEDTWEEPSGDGRSCRHACMGVQLVDGKKRLWWIPYGAFLWAEGSFNGGSFRIEVLRGEALYEVLIEGPEAELQKLIDKLLVGKRELVRVNGANVTSIQVRDVPKRSPA